MSSLLTNAAIELRRIVWPVLRRLRKNPSKDFRKTEPALFNLMRVLFEYKQEEPNPALSVALAASEVLAAINKINSSIDGLEELLQDSEEVEGMMDIVFGQEQKKTISQITVTFSDNAELLLSHLRRVTRQVPFEWDHGDMVNSSCRKDHYIPAFTASDRRKFKELEDKLFEVRRQVVSQVPSYAWRAQLQDNNDKLWKALVRIFRYGVPKWEEIKTDVHWDFIRYYVDRILEDAEHEDVKALESPGVSSTSSSSPGAFGTRPIPIPSSNAYLMTNRDRSSPQSWSHGEKKVTFESSMMAPPRKPRSSSHSLGNRPTSPTQSNFSTTFIEAESLRPNDTRHHGREPRQAPSPVNDPGLDIAKYISWAQEKESKERPARKQLRAHDARSYGSGTVSPELSNRSPATSVAEEPLHLKKEDRMKRSQSRGRYMTRAERKLREDSKRQDEVEKGRQERVRMRQNKGQSGEIRVHRRDGSGGSGGSFGSSGSVGLRSDGERGRRRHSFVEVRIEDVPPRRA